MKKFSIFISTLLVLTVLALGVFTAFAETEPAVPTDPVAPTAPVTDPVDPVPTTVPVTVPATGATDTTDSTDPSGATEPSTAVSTEPVTEFTRPTEYDENDQPNTYSDYVSPAPIYTPSDQDFQKNEWEEIKLDIKDDKPNPGGVGDFSNIKNNNTKGDEKSPLLLILCIVFWCLALSCLTFVILYKPKTAKAVATKTTDKSSVRRTEPKVSDDYNDGF